MSISNLEWLYEHDSDFAWKVDNLAWDAGGFSPSQPLDEIPWTHPKMREWLLSEHETNVIDGGTNGIVDGPPLVDGLPEGDAVEILRKWANFWGVSHSTYTQCDPNWEVTTMRTLADMVGRDYVRREKWTEAIRAMKAAQDAMEQARDERDEWRAKADGFTKALEKMGCSVLANGTVFEPMDAQRDSNGTCPDDNETCPDKAATGAVFVNGSQMFPPKLLKDANATRNNSGENVAHATNEQISGFDEPKSEENADNGTTKCGMRDFDDSREQLEADVRIFVRSLPTTAEERRNREVIALLDRQAAITAEEAADAWGDYSDSVQSEIAELQQQVDELTAERDELREKLDDDWRYVSLKKSVGLLKGKVDDLLHENTMLHAQCYERDGVTATARIQALQRENANLAHDLDESEALREEMRERLSRAVGKADEIASLGDLGRA